MNNELQHFKKFASISVDHEGDILVVCKEDCANYYDKDQLPVVPKGAQLLIEFGGDFGVYAIAGFDGVTHKVKIDVTELHKLEFIE